MINASIRSLYLFASSFATEIPSFIICVQKKKKMEVTVFDSIKHHIL